MRRALSQGAITSIVRLLSARAVSFQQVVHPVLTEEAEVAKLWPEPLNFQTGNYVDPSKITVSEFFDRWRRDWAANNVGPKSLERYKEIISTYIGPGLVR